MSASASAIDLAASADSLSVTAEDAHVYELEDPACSWVEFVQACHISNHDERRLAVQLFINVAKNSHWDMEKYIAFGSGYESPPTTGGDAEQGGDYKELGPSEMDDRHDAAARGKQQQGRPMTRVEELNA